MKKFIKMTLATLLLAFLFASNATAQTSEKYEVTFKSTREKVKGTWTSWSKWSTIRNSYFQVSVVKERSIYNFKFYENGKLVKNYNITYDDKETKSNREEYRKYKQMACYKINGTQGGYIYLLNTQMNYLLENPEKWANESNALVVIFDAEKAGNNTKIK